MSSISINLNVEFAQFLTMIVRSLLGVQFLIVKVGCCVVFIRQRTSFRTVFDYPLLAIKFGEW